MRGSEQERVRKKKAVVERVCVSVCLVCVCVDSYWKLPETWTHVVDLAGAGQLGSLVVTTTTTHAYSSTKGDSISGASIWSPFYLSGLWTLHVPSSPSPCGLTVLGVHVSRDEEAPDYAKQDQGDLSVRHHARQCTCLHKRWRG